MNKQRFIHLWNRVASAVDEAQAEAVFDRLQRLYRDDFRVYHNEEHIEFCLKWLDQYRAETESADAIELAIWFHDACYSQESSGHEQRSADLFRSLAAEVMDDDLIEKVVRFILATTHQGEPESLDAKLLVDIDMASFSEEWSDYLRDTSRCRAEKPHRSNDEFYKDQLIFLRHLLSRPTLYYSQTFLENHERRAQSNITRLTAVLAERYD